VLAKAARVMVVFAVHIHGDCATNSGEARSGHDRRKPALRREKSGEFAQGDAGFHSNQACVTIKGDDAVKTRHVDGLAAII
jgi:hypothetical protein